MADEEDDLRTGHPSFFPGITFRPHEATLRRGRADPMEQGLDRASLQEVEERIAYMKEKKVIPESYSAHNPVQLLPERVIDTTNREVKLMAEKYNFDPDGFRKGDPLRKDLFYMSPYVTCRWCNLVNHVDINAVRRMIHLNYDKRDKEIRPFPEKLPPCKKCERVDHFIIGIHDFSQQIAIRMEEERRKAEREYAAACIMQRNYRAYLRRMYGSAFSARAAAERLLFYRAATAMNAIARGRLARRRIVCERHLKVIKEAHPILLKHSLKNKADGVKRLKVFWYRRQEQVDLLFRDYIALLDRMGHDPPRSVVEKNVAEIARRILERKAELILMIQKRWRGFLARRIVKLYRVEIIRLRQWWIANILKVQRTFRGHRCRVNILKYFQEAHRDSHMERYRKEAEESRYKRQRQEQFRLTKVVYQKQHAEEFVARSTQRIDKAVDHGMRRMRAFEKSIYADGELKNQLDNLMAVDRKMREDEEAEVTRQRTRRKSINDRIAERGPPGLGLRGFTRDDLLDEVAKVERLGAASGIDMNKALGKGQTKGEKLSSPERIKKVFGVTEDALSPVESSRSKKMRALYADELSDIMNLTVERVMHDHTNKHVPKAIKAHNAEAKGVGGGLLHFKFPKNVNDKPMDWLNDDIEVSIMHMDKNKKAARSGT